MMTETVFDAAVALFARGGSARYFGEPVTQQAHALQCAFLAEREGASDALVVAALLHDVGHLLHGLGESAADDSRDGQHAEASARWLAQFFGPEVTEPVRLHVDAKRYLCTADRTYVASLSPASRERLARQGGPLLQAELADFADRPFAMDAVRLRRWDDRARTPGLTVSDLDHYAAKMLRVSLPRSKRPVYV